jgi:D-serine/D-alanine/glycine transporter
VWFILLGAAWFVLRRRPAHQARFATFQAELQADQDFTDAASGKAVRTGAAAEAGEARVKR